MTNEVSAKMLCRSRMKARLSLIRPGESAHVRERLAEHLRSVVAARPGLWGAYHALPLEADPAIGSLPGVEWVYPRMEQGSLVFHRGASFVKGRFGIAEPPASAEVIALDRLVGVLVPGLAFDRDGRRLGKGLGFYDRTLARPGGLLRVGVAFAMQVIERVPTDRWDIPLDAVVTETSVFWSGGSRQWKS